MKNYCKKNWTLAAIIVFLGIIAGCSSSSGRVNHNWDRALDYNHEDSAFYQYAPDYDLYQETKISEVFNSTNKNDKSFDGYYVSENVVIVGMDIDSSNGNSISVGYPDDIENRKNTVLGGWEPANKYRLFIASNYNLRNKMSKELKILTTATIWYRGIYRADSKHFGMFLDKYEITGQYEMTPNEVDIARAEREAERKQPRFSPEGQEYVKRTLTEAVGEANNSANRGKTLFFESRVATIKEGATVGQWFVSGMESNSNIIMYYYGEMPLFLFLPTILYRVEISRIGVTRYVIDSFRE
jgi:hypothetical protein